jgi:Spy/CpxP family protein refolding chaperone
MTARALAPTGAGRRTVAALTLLVVIIGSALGGAALDRVYVRKTAHLVGDTTFHPLSSALRTPSAADRREIRDEMAAELKLTPDQSRLIDSIMAARSGQFEDLRSSIRPRVEALLADLRADVEKALTPEQRARYRKLRNDNSVPRS